MQLVMRSAIMIKVYEYMLKKIQELSSMQRPALLPIDRPKRATSCRWTQRRLAGRA